MRQLGVLLRFALLPFLLAACDSGDPSGQGPNGNGDPETDAQVDDDNGDNDDDGSPGSVEVTCGEGTPVERHGQLRIEGTQMIDECDQQVQLKGVSSMWLNWDARGFALSQAGLRYMRDEWGLEVFRIAMGIEPAGAYLASPGINTNKVHNIVANAFALGVYVIIDWHDHNAHEHQEEAIEFFSEMAETYGDAPHILYETFNEPLQVGWSDVIKPYHEAVVAAIRQHDPNNIIILGTPNWAQYVDEAAQDPLDGENLTYALHFYSCSHEQWLRDRAQAAYAMGLPMFVSEWGATPADGGDRDPIVCEGEAQIWHDWMNTLGISWAAWKLDGCQDSSCLFTDRNVSPHGDWTDAELNGHAPFVIARLRE